MSFIIKKELIWVLQEFFGSILININLWGRYDLDFERVWCAGAVGGVVQRDLVMLEGLGILETVLEVGLTEALTHFESINELCLFDKMFMNEFSNIMGGVFINSDKPHANKYGY